jgi:hypothetical protein
MDTLQIQKQNALAAHDAADGKGKTLLEKLFGKEVFSKDIKDRVKTIEDACSVLGVDCYEAGSAVVPDGMQKDLASIQAYKYLILVARALNEGWEPDWTNSNQTKYYPWFDASAGSGLSYHGFDLQYSFSSVGSRLCFKSAELAKYAGTQFIDLYNQFFLIK